MANLSNPPLITISFGGGIQSTAMLILAALGHKGFLDACGGVPEIAIFADPGAELDATYRHIAYMVDWCARYGLEVKTIEPVKSIQDAILEDQRFSSIPAFAEHEDGRKAGRLRRNCTTDYKVQQVVSGIRAHLGVQPRKHVKRWVHTCIGISTDEITRMKNNSGIPWQVLKYPLIDLGMSRDDCTQLIKDACIMVPPKSACYFCPFHDNAEWASIKEKHPKEFNLAVEFDSQLRDIKDEGRGGIKNRLFLHRSMTPLAELTFEGPVALKPSVGNSWDEECTGLCGL